MFLTWVEKKFHFLATLRTQTHALMPPKGGTGRSVLIFSFIYFIGKEYYGIRAVRLLFSHNCFIQLQNRRNWALVLIIIPLFLILKIYCIKPKNNYREHNLITILFPSCILAVTCYNHSWAHLINNPNILSSHESNFMTSGFHLGSKMW